LLCFFFSGIYFTPPPPPGIHPPDTPFDDTSI
jgi:hypothetical protein